MRTSGALRSISKLAFREKCNIPLEPFYSPGSSVVPIECKCGRLNDDGSKFCSGCGSRLVFRQGEAVCGKCGTPNPGYVDYCGSCGADLEERFAKHVAGTDDVEMPADDSYVKYGNSRSLLFWGGTFSMTKTQYLLRTAMSLVAVFFGASIFFMAGLPIVGFLLLLFGVGSAYFWWRIGREGAGG